MGENPRIATEYEIPAEEPNAFVAEPIMRKDECVNPGRTGMKGELFDVGNRSAQFTDVRLQKVNLHQRPRAYG